MAAAEKGRPYFSVLARFRCGRVELETLMEYRAGSSKGVGRSDPLPHVHLWCPCTQ
jgi:hypothetical protein